MVGRQFAVLALTTRVAGVDNAQVALGAAIFSWARVAYLLVYLIGCLLAYHHPGGRTGDDRRSNVLIGAVAGI